MTTDVGEMRNDAPGNGGDDEHDERPKEELLVATKVDNEKYDADDVENDGNDGADHRHQHKNRPLEDDADDAADHSDNAENWSDEEDFAAAFATRERAE